MKATIYLTAALATAILFGSCKKSTTPANTGPSSVTVITSLPGVTTNAIDSIVGGFAFGGGNISSEGTSAITAVGVCWDTKSGPTTLRAHTDDGAGVGTYASVISNLLSNTTYYVRAYATNATGTAYGNEVTFKTPAGWDLVNSTLGITNNISDLAVNGNVIYAATGNGVFRSDNQGSQWVGAGLAMYSIRAIAVSGNNVFAATSSGGVFLSTDGGTTWNPVNNGIGTYVVTDLVINGSLIFAATQGGGVYATLNNGGMWSPMNTGLLELYVNQLAVNGSNTYASTFNNGIYFSSNNGSSWTKISANLPGSSGNSAVLAASGSNVLAGTTNGLYISSDNGNVWTKVSTVQYTPYSIAAKGNDVYVGSIYSAFISHNNGNTFSNVSQGLNGGILYDLAVGDSFILATDGQRIWKYPL